MVFTKITACLTHKAVHMVSVPNCRHMKTVVESVEVEDNLPVQFVSMSCKNIEFRMQMARLKKVWVHLAYGDVTLACISYAQNTFSVSNVPNITGQSYNSITFLQIEEMPVQKGCKHLRWELLR
jgi:hypothetical protein